MHRLPDLVIPTILSLLLLTMAASPHAATITLAVANSTCSTIKQVGKRYTENHPLEINYICKSSGRLAKGLRGGAIQADIYISANREWMQYMIKDGLIDAANVISPWGNRLVVSAPVDSPLTMATWADLENERIDTILIGDPGTAPFGRYAKQALQRTGVWEAVKHKITTKKHITLLAGTLVTSSARTVGILFPTNLTDRLKTLYPVDPAWHPPIRYYMAPVAGAVGNIDVIQLLDYIQGEQGRDIFRRAGFDMTAP